MGIVLNRHRYFHFVIHSAVQGEGNVIHNIKKSNDYSRRALKYLVDNNYISKKASYVCDLCISHASSFTPGAVEKMTTKEEEEADTLNIVPISKEEVELIQSLDDVMQKLVSYIGKIRSCR